MVYVVVEELIPESHREGNVDLAAVSLMAGFVVMMVLIGGGAGIATWVIGSLLGAAIA
mgnify:CR=1 FL=1